jgi:hypothetical protein
MNVSSLIHTCSQCWFFITFKAIQSASIFSVDDYSTDPLGIPPVDDMMDVYGSHGQLDPKQKTANAANSQGSVET